MGDGDRRPEMEDGGPKMGDRRWDTEDIPDSSTQRIIKSTNPRLPKAEANKRISKYAHQQTERSDVPMNEAE